MLNSFDVSYILNGISINISTIKTILIILSSYYTNFKITNTKVTFNKSFLYNLIYIIIGAVVCGLAKYNLNYLVSMFLAIIIISLIFSKDNLSKGLLTTIISLAINYIILFVSVSISFIISIIFKIDNNYMNLGMIIFFYTGLIYITFRNKKLKYGITFLQKRKENEYIDILILNISIIILVLTTLFLSSSITVVMEITPCFAICIIIMFITIQKSLQLYYKQKLLVQELNETKAELEKKTKEIEELEKENLNFSKKSHTLAHKQKSLEYKLQEMIMKTEISKEEVGEIKDRLKEIEKDLYKEKTAIELDKTGIAQIDDMLKYMQSECIKNKIDFELQLKGNIHYMTNNLIEKENLETLLADHIKNAIIAINHTDNINRSILVRLGQIDETYGLYIYDSGIEFEKETLQNLGKKPSTTHSDEGGTGMGFMNTFDTLRKCNASLVIEEYNEPSKDNYTKALMIKFDNKNEFKIKSYREKEIT